MLKVLVFHYSEGVNCQNQVERTGRYHGKRSYAGTILMLINASAIPKPSLKVHNFDVTISQKVTLRSIVL